MKERHSRRRPCIALVAFVVLAGHAEESAALCKPPEEAAIASFLGPAVVDTYIRSPRLLLTNYQHHLTNLSLAVRQVAVRGGEATAALIAVAPFASDGQRQAIAQGLKMAADVCRSRDLSISKAISTAAQNSNDRVIKRAFYNVYEAPLPTPRAPSVLDGKGFGVSQANKSLIDPDRSELGLPDPFAPVGQ